MKANRFEDLIFWQKARELTKSVYSFTKKGDFKRDFGLRDQIQRSCVSVMSNIAEGFCRGGNKEFIQFLFVARGSLAEVQSQLYISRDLDYISDLEFKKVYSLTEEIFRLIGSFIQKTKIAGKQGLKSI
jgi:four helix bundle protein